MRCDVVKLSSASALVCQELDACGLHVLLVHRAAALAVGGFDAALEPHFHGADFSLRLQQRLKLAPSLAAAQTGKTSAPAAVAAVAAAAAAGPPALRVLQPLGHGGSSGSDGSGSGRNRLMYAPRAVAFDDNDNESRHRLSENAAHDGFQGAWVSKSSVASGD